jgi:predicted PurR-regulated permease PerM
MTSGIDDLTAAQQPVREMLSDYPGDRRNRVIRTVVVSAVVLAFALCAVFMAILSNRIDHLDKTVSQQSAQIEHLQREVTTVNANLGAAVACLQTVSSLQGLCTKLVK